MFRSLKGACPQEQFFEGGGVQTNGNARGKSIEGSPNFFWVISSDLDQFKRARVLGFIRSVVPLAGLPLYDKSSPETPPPSQIPVGKWILGNLRPLPPWRLAHAPIGFPRVVHFYGCAACSCSALLFLFGAAPCAPKRMQCACPCPQHDFIITNPRPHGHNTLRHAAALRLQL
jgi:hypothetical protein